MFRATLSFRIVFVIALLVLFERSSMGAPLHFTIETKWSETNCRLALIQISSQSNEVEYRGVSGSRMVAHSSIVSSANNAIPLSDIFAKAIELPESEPVQEDLKIPGEGGPDGHYKITIRPSSEGEVFVIFNVEIGTKLLADKLGIPTPSEKLFKVNKVIEARFLKGNWKTYIAGEDVQFEFFGEEVQLSPTTTQGAEKLFQEKMRQLELGVSDFGFQVKRVQFGQSIAVEAPRLYGNRNQLIFEKLHSEWKAKIDFTLEGLDFTTKSESSILDLSESLLELEKSAKENLNNKAFQTVARLRRRSIMIEGFLCGPGIAGEYFRGELTNERIRNLLREIPQAQAKLEEASKMILDDSEIVEGCARLNKYLSEIQTLLREELGSGN